MDLAKNKRLARQALDSLLASRSAKLRQLRAGNSRRGAIDDGRQGLGEFGIQRRRTAEVEHVLQGVSELVTQRQMLGARSCDQESLLNQRQHGSVIADGVRDIVGLGEWGDGHKRNAYTQLIEIGAIGRIRTGGIGG